MDRRKLGVASGCISVLPYNILYTSLMYVIMCASVIVSVWYSAMSLPVGPSYGAILLLFLLLFKHSSNINIFIFGLSRKVLPMGTVQGFEMLIIAYNSILIMSLRLMRE